jgi:DASS family divalent anion:Na+ symporter
MYTPLVDALISAKCPPKIAAFSLAIVSALAGCVTPYGSGSAPLYFASGFIPTKTFWSAGALFMVLNCAVMCGLGLGYYTLLGWNNMDAR